MYTLFRDAPARRLGQSVDPNIIYIRRTYLDLLEDVKAYYRRAPKAVESSNVFANIIQHFVIDEKIDDAAWAKKVEDQAKGLSRVFGFTSSINRGKIFEKGVTLGPNCEEIVIASSESFDKRDINKHWWKLTPLKYLYHTRTDTNLPIMNNTTPGKGYGVVTINIPMLLVQYRYWLRWQKSNNVEQLENAYRFIGSIVLPNLIDSYLDIAFFNRMARQAQGIKNVKFPVPHPFYLTDLSPRLDKLAERQNFQNSIKGIELEGLAWITPMILKQNLFELMELPKDPVTFQNEWAYTLARLPYVKYLFMMLQKNPGYDRSQVNEVMIDLIDATNDQVYNVMGQSDFVKSLRRDVDQLIKLMKK